MSSPSMISILALACVAALASAVDRPTGCNPPTAADQAWMDANLIRVTSVLPNRLAMQRVAAERQVQGLLAAPATGTVAEDGAEIIGVKGAVVAAPAAAPQVAASLMAYPRAVDNSTEPWFPPIGSQRGGSCAAFSTTYYTMTSQVARLRGWNVKSDNIDAHKFSTRFTYNLINNGADNGSWITGAYDVMLTMGSATYQTVPYNVDDFVSWPTSAATWREAINYRMAESGSVEATDGDVGRANAKQMLADGYILNYATHIFDWQYTNFKNDPATSADDGLFAAGVPAIRIKVASHAVHIEGTNSGHGMTIVGYNDDVWCDLNNNGVVDAGEKGAFRIANSWGNYEDGGFIWVSYDALKWVSGVTNGPNPAGRAAIFWNGSMYWMSARASYTPTLVAEITATHAKRDQMYLGVGRGNNTVAAPSTTWNPNRLQGSGGSWAFDGTTTPVAATFVIDCTDVLNSGTGNRWFASFRDNAAGNAGNFQGVRFIDSNNFVRSYGATNPAGGLPMSVDNTTAYFYVDSTNPPTVATAAKATPNPVTGIYTVLSVLGADDTGETNLTYTWATTGNPPAAVTFSANNSNDAKNSTVIFSKQGTYEFQCTIKDSGNLTVTSSVTVTVNNSSILPVTAGLAFWADTSQLSGLTNGQQVDTWADMSGKANHALRQSGSSAGYPKYVSNGLNGKPVMRFNSANSSLGDYFKFNRISTIRTVFWVMKENAALSDGHFLLGDDSAYGFHRSTANGPLWDGSYASASILGGTTKLMGISVNGTTTALPAGQFQIISLVTTGNVQANQICQDRSFHGSWQGDIAEIIIYTNALSASEEALVNTYLANKYSLSESTNTAPTVATAAAATPSPVTGTTTALSVLGADGAGEAGLTYHWATTGTPPAVVTFSANNSNAAKTSTVTFTKAGSYTFQCTIKDFFNKSVTSNVTVSVNQTATSVVVTPTMTTVNTVVTQQFSASVKDQFGATLTSQPAITWSLSATTSGTINGSGIFSANVVAGGPYTVTATGGAKSGTAMITVANTAPVVATAAVAVLSADGKSVNLSVLGADDSGEPALKYSWSLDASAPAAVTYDVNGDNVAKNSTATFTQAGSYIFTGTITDAAGLSASSAVTVVVLESAFAMGSDGGGDSGGGGGCGLGSGLAGLAMVLMALMRVRLRQR